MKDILIGCGQITWQGENADRALAEIAQAGYAGAPASPAKDSTTEQTLAAFEQVGLRPAPGYLGVDFWDQTQEDAILARAEDHAQFAKRAGCTELYVAAGGFTTYKTSRGLTRAQVAGHVTPADEMTAAEYEQFAKVLDKVGEITLSHGVRSCFHNHVGSVIETRAEVDRLFGMVNRDAVFMGPDTGHLAWAGVDVVSFFRDYADSILTAHIKDIDGEVLARGVPAEWDYATFSDAGIFTELGLGIVDFPALFDILDHAGFSGWLIVETDVTQQESALVSAQMSRDYLRSLGM